MPFLERLSEHLLGEKLRMPSLDVWWRGEPAALSFRPGQSRPHDRTALPRPGPRAHRRGHAGTCRSRAALVDRIRAQPGQFVAQYPMTPSLTPKWDGQSLVPSAVVLRAFVVADHDTYHVAEAARPRARLATPPCAR